jgi:hypothetical protein
MGRKGYELRPVRPTSEVAFFESKARWRCVASKPGHPMRMPATGRIAVVVERKSRDGFESERAEAASQQQRVGEHDLGAAATALSHRELNDLPGDTPATCRFGDHRIPDSEQLARGNRGDPERGDLTNGSPVAAGDDSKLRTHVPPGPLAIVGVVEREPARQERPQAGELSRVAAILLDYR